VGPQASFAVWADREGPCPGPFELDCSASGRSPHRPYCRNGGCQKERKSRTSHRLTVRAMPCIRHHRIIEKLIANRFAKTSAGLRKDYRHVLYRITEQRSNGWPDLPPHRPKSGMSPFYHDDTGRTLPRPLQRLVGGACVSVRQLAWTEGQSRALEQRS
jgi:hypothetical protein